MNTHYSNEAKATLTHIAHFVVSALNEGHSTKSIGYAVNGIYADSMLVAFDMSIVSKSLGFKKIAA
jgi:hypothetical protein